MAAFIWRRHLNSETLVTTTHKEPEDVVDGIDTQVNSQMNDKCRVKMIKKKLYNVKNLLCKGGGGELRKRGRRSLSRITYKKDHLI